MEVRDRCRAIGLVSHILDLLKIILNISSTHAKRIVYVENWHAQNITFTRIIELQTKNKSGTCCRRSRSVSAINLTLVSEYIA